MRNTYTTVIGAPWQLLASVPQGDGDFTRSGTQQGLGSMVSTKDKGTYRPWEGKFPRGSKIRVTHPCEALERGM